MNLHNPQWQVLTRWRRHHRVPDAGLCKSTGDIRCGAVNRRTMDGEKLYPEKFHDIDMQKTLTTGINVLPY